MDLGFNQKKLEENLSKLPLTHQVAFAASCSERLYINYVAFYRECRWGDPTVLRKILDIIWEKIASEDIPSNVQAISKLVLRTIK